MKKLDITDFIKSLNVELPKDDEFLRISKNTPVIQMKKKEHFIHYDRGILLYALIAKYRPKSILEIGTANGYSTLCMAWSMVTHGIDGKIFTIDPIRPDLNVWKRIAPTSWLNRIEVITGYSGEVMSKKLFPKFDMGYIDGHHIYAAVKHDFYAFLQNANDNFCIIFDDYITEHKNHVKKALDEMILPNFDATILETNMNQQLEQIGKHTNKKFAMCWIQSTDIKKPLEEAFSQHEIETFLKKYRNFEARIRIRKTINQKLPFLKNIRFRFWKN